MRREDAQPVATWRHRPSIRPQAAPLLAERRPARSGDEVETRWRQSGDNTLTPYPAAPLPAPDLARCLDSGTLPSARKMPPPQPPAAPRGTVRPSAWLACERDPAAWPVASPGAAVLTHPRFEREPVANVRTRGPKRGALSLAAVRRQRAAAAELQAQALRCLPPHELLHDLAGDPLRPVAERDAIGAALALLDQRLRRPGAVFDSPSRVREFLALRLAERDTEGFGVMFLDGQHALIEFALLFEGTLTQTSVYPREVARHALRVNAGAVILAHNHPSGKPEPSPADERLTHALRCALALIDVRVLDHVIVGRLSAVSMAERGMV